MRQAREAAEMPLTEMAEVTQYSGGHLSRVERAKATPSRELVEAYEERLGTDGLLLSLYELVLAEQKTDRLRRRGVLGAGAQRRRQREPPAAHPGDASEFVADLGFPADGQHLPPDTEVVKRWRLRNVGTVPWVGRWLERDGACAGPAVVQSPRRVRINDTLPGETVDIEARLRTPPLPGSTIAYWRMVDSADNPCFPDRYADGIYVHLIVREKP